MDTDSIRELRQSTTPWQMSIRDTPPRCDPARRYRVLLIVSPGANNIRHMQPLAGEADDDALLAALSSAMLQSPTSSMASARPPALLVDDDELAKRLQSPLEACGIVVEVAPKLTAIDPVIEALSTRDNLFSSVPKRAPKQAPKEAPPANELHLAASTDVDADDEVMPSLISVEHAVSIATLTPAMLDKVAPPLDPDDNMRALVIHCADVHADIIAEALTPVEHIGFARFGEGERDFELVVGLRDDELVGAVTVCPITHDRPPLSEQFESGERLYLVVAVGPPGRLRMHEIAHGQQVLLRAPE